MNPVERRRARAATRVRLREWEQKKETRVKSIALVAVVALVVVLAVGLLIPRFCSNEEVSPTAADPAALASDNQVGESASSEEEVLEPYRAFYFYEEDRSQRYLNYHEANPDLTPEQVVVRVNVDLDTAAYEVTSVVSNPDALEVLVTKHFSLPLDYEPSDLVEMGDIYLRATAADALAQLITAARANGITLTPCSGYRSSATQEILYNNYADSIGTEWAEVQSAHAGYSEHQTGWAVDFSPADHEFYDTPEAAWLEERAATYGFIVRYTEESSNATLYIHEPWHIRYVGPEIARLMRDKGIDSFEEYWVKYVQHTPPTQ